MDQLPMVNLNDGRQMPQFGLGFWRTEPGEAEQVLGAAVGLGYRLFDTAAIYGNESGVGDGVRSCGAPREQLSITTKLWNENHGYDAALKAFDESLARLGLDYVDLYLIHWPAPKKGLYVETWRALTRLKDEGRARSIGVSNFLPEHLERIIGETGVTPAVNQIELHPRFQQRRSREFHDAHGVRTESWSPLGQGQLLADPAIAGLARKHGKSPAQIVIRWHLDNGLIVIPKTVSQARLRENIEVSDFRLDPDDLKVIAALDSADGRIGPDPLNAPF